MRYILISLMIFSCASCRKINYEAPTLQKGGDSEQLQEDKTRPDDLHERLRGLNTI